MGNATTIGGSKNKRKPVIKYKSKAVDAVLYIVAIFLGIITLYPVVFVISNSISEPVQAATGKVWLLPKGFSTSAYKFIIESPNIVRSFVNSVVYTFLMVVGNLVITMMCGFGLSKKNLVFRKFITVFLLIPLWFSGGLIPSFVNMTRLHLYNTLWAVFLPMLINIYNVILARTFIVRLPPALIEAAMIDGASVPSIFLRIVIPLSKPIMAVLSLYVALGVWNSWFPFLVYLPTREDLHPLSFFLVQVLLKGSQINIAPGLSIEEMLRGQELMLMLTQLKYATIVVASLPVMCLYPFAQKYFVQGVMLGSLKE